MPPTVRTPLLSLSSQQLGRGGASHRLSTPAFVATSIAIAVLVALGGALGGLWLLHALDWWPNAATMALAPVCAATGLSPTTLLTASQVSSAFCFVSAGFLATALTHGCRKGEASDSVPSPRPKRRVSRRVQDLMGVIGSEKERQRRRAVEAEHEARAAEMAVPAAPPRDATREPPPVQQVGESEWLISGMYEHQVLKCGLWHLDNTWPEEGLYDLPSGGVVDPFCGRRKLILDLLKGDVKLSSILKADLEAAQYGLRSLSLRQLLRLRVLHLAFTPSGCGSDAVGTLAGAHEAFLSSVDRSLFEQLGRKATEGVAEPEDDFAFHRYGREAVLFTAAASAVTSASLWAWWLSPRQRVLFHVKDLSCVPDGGTAGASGRGVLEVTDASRPDVAEPTGKLRWLSWRVALQAREEDLSPVAKLFGESSGSPADATPKDGVSGQAVGASASGRPALSSELLSSRRSSLRKTGTLELITEETSFTSADPEQGTISPPTSSAGGTSAGLCSTSTSTLVGRGKNEEPSNTQRASAARAPPPMPVLTTDMVQDARSKLKKSKSDRS